MKTLKYKTIDKSDWPRGPWDDEPDKMQWMDKKTGLPCLIVRGPHGSWCGYVGVPKAHPAFEKGYDDVDASAHGGLTFADRCSPGAEDHGICHVVEEGEDDKVWWLGFDCAHSGDFVPAYDRAYKSTNIDLTDIWPEEGYKSIKYVKREVRRLAAQLRAMVT